MKLTPNCKINIGLSVVRRRQDGYHDIETIFYPVYGFHDELEIEKADVFSFEQSGLAVDCSPEKNLIVRCYYLMASRYAQVQPVAIRFRKNIPFGAGLGGGSSDAAHTAIALNELFELGLSKPQLAQTVSELGADCAFFIYNVPCFATGIGEQLTPIDMNLTGKRLILIKPDVYVSTKDAYANIVPREERGIDTHNDRYINDFEETVFKLHPELQKIKQRLLDCGAEYAAMSGSGSTIFGLFDNDTESSSTPQLRALHEEFASMIVFDNTL